jgi:hypothetical protein
VGYGGLAVPNGGGEITPLSDEKIGAQNGMSLPEEMGVLEDSTLVEALAT